MTAASREEFPCNQCEHYRQAMGRPYCTGPHVIPSVVTGKPLMELPAARYSGGSGLRPGVPACGESGHHWKQRKPADNMQQAVRGLPFSWGAAACIMLLAAIGFVYFNGVPLCR